MDHDIVTKIAKATDNQINKHGFAFQLVLPETDVPGYTYTIGFSEKGKFDFLFVGDCSKVAVDLINSMIEALPGFYPPNHEMNVFGIPMWLVEAQSQIHTYALGVPSRLHRIETDYPPRLIQIVAPDQFGNFPWDENYTWVDQGIYKKPVTIN